MTNLNLTPRTRTVPVASLRVGHVVLESYEHPARVTRIVRVGTVRLSVYCKYIWSADKEQEWLLGTFLANAPIEKAVD